mmetsp:Transcript_14398/g.40932  ORF Transcript_14398/g.40932 Transcript_14398/m.40932 type:complete len:156 (-) Transcript_14398:394-861(-)
MAYHDKHFIGVHLSPFLNCLDGRHRSILSFLARAVKTTKAVMPSEQYVASYHPLTFYIHSDAATTVSMDATESPSMVFATAVVAAFDAVGAMVGGVTGAFVGTSNSDSGQSSMVYSELKSRSQIEPEIMQFPLVTLTVQPPAEVENKEQQLPSNS